MTHLLDTNTCIRYLNGRVPNVRIRLAAMPPNRIAVCSIVKAEMYTGARKSHNPARTRAAQDVFLNQFISLPFDDTAASLYADLRARLEFSGTPIGPYDLQIAAIALANNLTLVTHNMREFNRVPGLQLEDWEV